MIGLVAKMKVKEGKADEFIEVFKGLITNVRKEEGTLYYTLNRDKADPNTFVVMERYRDKEALKTHGSSPHFAEASGKFGALLDGPPELIMLEEIASI
ncbi:MAG: antibiotic biosynthesis monooxygenase [Deltaproteobacteria bacterium]|nr:antibiotic biosynthesis monooxygenase [Deltaproteobacteria bacterium]